LQGAANSFFSGDGAAATAAGLDSPNGVAVDAAGNIYIGDTRNQRIRVVNSSGSISTLAGNGTKAYAGDGGVAVSASLARPRGLSVDAQGNIYFADSDNNTIRLIANTGTHRRKRFARVCRRWRRGHKRDTRYAACPCGPGYRSLCVVGYDNNLIRAVGSNGVINTTTGTGSGAGSGQGVGGETLTLSGSTSTAYGSSVKFTVIFSNAGKIATGQVSLVDTANSTTLASAGLSNNVASISV
jgi:hypothetical protein